MIFFYLLALFPIGIGGVLWILNKKVNWVEWAAGSLAALLVSVSMHLIAHHGLTDDIQTLSGQISSVRQFSQWTEYYEYAVYRTEYYTATESYTSNGKNRTRTVRRSRQVFDHWQPTQRTHRQHYIAYSNIETDYEIDGNTYIKDAKDFGGYTAIRGNRATGEHNSRMIGGDINDYTANNKTNYIIPVTKLQTWENKVKGAGPSVFSFAPVDEKAPVYIWPENSNPWRSDRVISAPIDILKWDQMNARLNPSKKVNVIIVNFKNLSSDVAELQKSKWLGGKKNDLVLLYGVDKQGSTVWSDVFSWSKSENVKSNLKTILLNNKVNDDIIPLIETEIRKNYILMDFEKDFSYLDIKPRPIHYFWAILIMVLTQIGFWLYACFNEFEKK